MKNPGSILEPACLYADQGEDDLNSLVEVVRRYKCRKAVIHGGDISYMAKEKKFARTKVAVVVDFPYGRSDVDTLRENVRMIASRGVTSLDVCVNLKDILADDWEAVGTRFSVVYGAMFEALSGQHIFGECEVKAIVQLPYLFQYAPNTIEPLLGVLAESGVSVIKDWTTVMNFSKPVDTSLPTRIAYLDYLKSLIETESLPLKIKIAGGVRAENVIEFVMHGADILGVGVQHVSNVVAVLSVLEHKSKA